MILTVTKGVHWPETIAAAISHYAEKLGISQLPFSVTVISKPMKKNGGLCRYENMGESVPNFTVFLDPPVTQTSYFEVLAHEMVHVRQFLTKQITFKTAKRNNGKSYLQEYYKGVRTDNIPYKNKPCEQQALRLQRKLLFSFLNSQNV